MMAGDLYDIASEHATDEKSARVLNRAGACVGWYNWDEWEDLAEVIENSDRVEIYDDGGRWTETLRGDEFKALVMGELFNELGGDL